MLKFGGQTVKQHHRYDVSNT